MASLYEQLMASKGAPKAAAAPNSTQLRKAPVSLRTAMRKYAAGGDVGDQGFDDGRDMSRSVMQEAPLQGGNLGAGLAQGIQGGLSSGNLMQALMAAAQQAQAPQTMSPPPERPSTNDFDRFKQDMEQTRRPPEPRYESEAPPRPPEPRYEEPPRPRAPDQDTPYVAPSTPQGPRTSYRINDDGSRTEIGYDGQPVSGYTPEQWAMHNATTGVTPSEYRYVWNGEGYTKVPNGPQIGYNPEENVPPPPREDPQELTKQYYNPDESLYDKPDPEPIYEPMPEPRYYEPDTAPYPDTASMPMFPDTAPYPDTAPMPNYDIGYDSDVNKQKQAGQQSEGLSALIAKLLAGGGGGGSLEEQRKLMSLLEMLKGK